MLKIRKIIFIILFLFIGIASTALFFKLQSHKNHKRFNVILILIDALRPDHLGCYGYKRNTSPNIDNLAKEGAIFTQAISQGSYTPPSLFSILTSAYPSTHKVDTFGVSSNKKIKTLPEILKTKGYYLGLISGRGGMSEFNFPELEKKFDSFYPPHKKHILANEVTDNAIQWLKLNKNKRFFLWLYYIDPHTPYKPPAPYDKLYANDKFIKENNEHIPIADESREEGLSDEYKVIPRITAVKGITDINYYISQYDGEISFTDRQIGAILTELKRLDLYDNTLIVITSDHGESMGERNFYFVHGVNLYDELLKVPLIISGRNVIPRGKIINSQVRLIDIMPTILDIVNIQSNNIMQGISLLPLIREKDVPKLDSFSEGYEGYSEDRKHLTGIRTDKWKFIEVHNVVTNTYTYELYDLENDPRELNNLVLGKPEKVNLFKKKIRDYTSSCEEIRKSILGKDFIDKPVILDEETKERLRSLGYIK